MDTLLIIVAIVFWFLVLGFCASAAWDAAKANRAFVYTGYVMGIVLSGNMTFLLLIEGF